MINVYTDGSIYPNPHGPMGWSFVAIDQWGEITEQTGALAATHGNSNNRAELGGMLLALEWLNGRAATIHTDSEYVRKGMDEWCHGWIRKGWRRMEHGVQVPIPNADLWQQIVRLRTREQRVIWVRGHNGTAGNERADKLAEGARLSVTQPMKAVINETVVPGRQLRAPQ